MKKSIKNTIMIGMAAVLIGTSAVTISYARGNKGAQMMPPQIQSGQFDNQQGNNPFGGFDQEGQKDKNKQFDSSQTPDDNNNQPPQSPGGSEQPPQTPKSSEDTDGKSKGEDTEDSKTTNTTLSIESLATGDSAQSADQNTAQKSFPVNGFSRKNTNVISALCYMFAALQIAIILAMLIYLIISKMNRISFNEVLANMRKKQ